MAKSKIRPPYRAAAAQVVVGDEALDSVDLQGDNDRIQGGVLCFPSGNLDAMLMMVERHIHHDPIHEEQRAALLCLLQEVRREAKAGSRRTVAIKALKLGAALQWAMLEPMDRPAYVGRRVVKGGEDGHALTHGTPAEKQQQWQTMVDRWEELRCQYPSLKKDTADGLVGGEFGVHPRTVRRARLEYCK
jgi:hypothetical protein